MNGRQKRPSGFPFPSFSFRCGGERGRHAGRTQGRKVTRRALTCEGFVEWGGLHLTGVTFQPPLSLRCIYLLVVLNVGTRGRKKESKKKRIIRRKRCNVARRSFRFRRRYCVSGYLVSIRLWTVNPASVILRAGRQ